MERAARQSTSDDTAHIRGNCLGCGYSLIGLLDPRCPECGRVFDPADRTTMDFGSPSAAMRLALHTWRRVRRFVSPVACIGASWFLWSFDSHAWMLLFWLPAVYLIFRRRWIFLGLFVLANPLSVLV